MMKILLLLLFSFSLPAQPVTLSLSGSATVKQGSSVTLSLNSTGATVTGPAGFQWTTVLPSGLSISSAVVGSASTAASKSLSCNSSNLTCLVFGVNQNVVANGQIASLVIQIPSNATPGAATINFSGVLSADKSAVAMTTTASPFTITVLSRSDINGDGSTNAADVSLMANQVLAGTCTDDQNSDGKCDLTDVLIVVLRALGL